MFFYIFISSFLYILSFPNFIFTKFSYINSIFGYISFVPLLYGLYTNKLKSFFPGWIFGVLSFIGIIYWIAIIEELGLLGPVALVLLSCYIGIYYGLFTLIESKFKFYSLIFSASLLVSLEYIRSYFLSGFPWGLIGYSQYLNKVIIQISSIFGVYGISFFVIFINASFTKFIISKKFKYLILIVIVFILVIVYGTFELSKKNENAYFKVALLQGNIPQEEKWNKNMEEKTYEIYKLLALSTHADLIIWPETALPSYLLFDKDKLLFIKNVIKNTNAYHIIGSLDADIKENAVYHYNAAICFSNNGEVIGKYHKIHLVPFGEFTPIPILKIFRVGYIEYTAGKKYVTFHLPFGRFSPFICYEVIFGNEVRKSIKGGDYIVNITNDAWYKKSAAAYQHALISIFRAVENRCYILRAANTGISCIISPNGEIIQYLDIFQRGIVSANVPIIQRKETIYSKFGDFLPILCTLFVMIKILLNLVKR